MLLFTYDDTGSIIGMSYRSSSYAANQFDHYYLERNHLGDVVAVYNLSGTKLVSYVYDDWGNITTTYHNGGASTSAIYNPFRYRGYYYDVETGFYYLNARYYDPAACRFISMDDHLLLGATGTHLSFNLYTYCENNPVNYIDPSGYFLSGKLNYLDPHANLFGSGGGTGVLSAKHIYENVEKASKIVLTSEFLMHTRTSFFANFIAEAGAGLGLSYEQSYGFFAVDLGTRVDFLGIQLKNGKLRTGSIGRSSFAVSLLWFCFGPQSDTFEDYNMVDKDSSNPYFFDFGPSWGQGAYFIVGYHIKISFSLSGFMKDICSYINERWY